MPVERFTYAVGRGVPQPFTVKGPDVKPPVAPESETPKPGALVLSPLKGPKVSPLGGTKVKVTGTVIRDGKPVAGQKVTVKYRKNLQQWNTKRVTTDAKGRYAVTVKADRYFRAYAQVGAVKTKRLGVRPTAKVTLTDAGTKTVKVTTVGYAKERPKVRIQAKVDGKWTTIAKARSKTNGSVKVRIEVKAGTKLRAVSEKTKWVRAGRSKTVRFS